MSEEELVTLIAPTEPPALKALGSVALVPEQYGVDVLFPAVAGLVGIQRKEFGDLYRSMIDGRLSKEVAQMQHLPIRALIVEGQPRFTNEGEYLNRFVKWDRASFERLTFSLLARGIWVLYSKDIPDTVRLIKEFRSWSEKADHLALDRHPQPKSHWLDKGKAWGSRVLQSVEGIGPKQADAIIAAFDGLPIKLTVSEEDLLTVKGIGKEKARNLVRAFSGAVRI